MASRPAWAAWSSRVTRRARGRLQGHRARRRPWSSPRRAHAAPPPCSMPPCSRQGRAPRWRGAPCSVRSQVAAVAAAHSSPLPPPRRLLPMAAPHSLARAHPRSSPPAPPNQAASPGSPRRCVRGGTGACRSSWRSEGRRGPPPAAAGTAAAAARSCCACSAQASTPTSTSGHAAPLRAAALPTRTEGQARAPPASFMNERS